VDDIASSFQSSGDSEEPKYGRFSRRLQAMGIDSILFLSLLLGCLMIITMANNQQVAWIVGSAFAATFFLYETISVATTGGTIGHWRKNLRVVDDKTGANISFVRAFVRFLIKTMLGLFSFIAMLVTRRRQAFHDVLTRTTVQIRDPAVAEVHHYLGQDLEIGRPGLPSVARRLIVTAAYMFVTFVLVQSLSLALMKSGILSRLCLVNEKNCSIPEYAMILALGIGEIVIWLYLIAKGWRGKLYGARSDPPRPAKRQDLVHSENN
jgi:uncharacterized RDD family membrane protein YckC